MTITIAMDAQEIMEHVDEMLAWEAVASEGELEYVWSHFQRAMPFIMVGANEYATMTPSGAVADDVAISDKTPDQCKAAHLSDYAAGVEVLPEYLDRSAFANMRYARLVEKDWRAEVPAGFGTKYGQVAGDDDILTSGDDVSDLVSTDQGAWRNVRYLLESIGELALQNRKGWIHSFRLPQTARVFCHQYVFAFQDGRSKSQQQFFGYWSRRFWNVITKKPLGVRIGSDEFHMSIPMLAEAVRTTMDRETCWEVEICLSRKRTGVALPTDSVGARELVRLLQRSEPRSGRRKSLVHWVSDHMRRQRREDASATIFVKEHLRGVRALDAGHHFVRIYPSTRPS